MHEVYHKTAECPILCGRISNGRPIGILDLHGAIFIFFLWVLALFFPSISTFGGFSFAMCLRGLAIASLAHPILLLGCRIWWICFVHFVLFELLLWVWLRAAVRRPIVAALFGLSLSVPSLVILDLGFFLWRLGSFPRWIAAPWALPVLVLLISGLLIACMIMLEKVCFHGTVDSSLQ
jgi:hypothetical protein